MADPISYTRSYSYSAYQASNPDKPLPAASVDNDLANVSASTQSLVDAIKSVRRSDGALVNGIVTSDALAADLVLPLYTPDAKGLTAERATYDASAKGFAFLDIQAGLIYWKLSGTSGDWSTGRTFANGATGATGPQGPQGVQGPAGEVTTAALNTALALKLDKTGGTITGTLGVNGAMTFGSTVALAADPSTALQAATKQYVDAASPSGKISYFARNTAPNGWLKANGAAISRTTYATLFSAITASATVTLTIATPGVVTWTGHTLIAGDPVRFSTTGALPTGITAGTIYYVVSGSVTANTFQVSATVGGAAINTSGTQSGVHTALFAPFGYGDGSTTFNVPDLRGEFVRGWDDARGVDTGRTLGSPQTDDFKSHTHTNSVAVPSASAGSNTILFDARATGGNIATAATGGTETRPRNVALLACIKY